MTGGPAQRSGLTVLGTGTAAAPVDRVTVTLGVDVVLADPGDAFRAAAVTATTILAVLAEHGVDSRAVRTTSLTLNPRVEYRDNHEHLVGYQAGQRFLVTLEGLSGVDRTLTDVATRAGEGVRIDGIALTASDPAGPLALAREQAFADAATNARQLAGLAGRALGRVEWVTEEPDAPTEVRRFRAVPLSASGAMPIAGGDTTVTVALRVHYSFAD